MNTAGTIDQGVFKAPSAVPLAIPQDLLLIHDLVGGDLPEASSSSRALASEGHNSPTTRTSEAEEGDAGSIASSSGEDSLSEDGDIDMKTDIPSREGEADKGGDSEEEVEAGLLGGDEGGDPMTMPDSSPENSDSDTTESDSDDADVIEEFNPAKMRELLDGIDDDDDEGGASGGRPVTVHEVLNEEVAIPNVTEVDPKETLERVGEVLSVLQDKIVIVKGLASQIAGHAPQRVLDTDTLLVFEDRKVLGYIHETFGPTHQPLYQVRFNDKFPLDRERAQTSRPIFHVPNRSHFVFVEKLKLAKGSDASNAHDEEPGDDEVEFSDDEEEAAYKRMVKERRSGSRASSRAATPGVSARRDYDSFDDAFRSNNPYDEYGAYDVNYDAGPSRPLPIPYDDPYSDSFSSITADRDGDSGMRFNDIGSDAGHQGSIRPRSMGVGDSGQSAHSNDRNLGSGPRHHHTRGRGRGGHRHKQPERGRRGRGRASPQHSQRQQVSPQQGGSHDYSPGLTPPSGFIPPYSQQLGYGGGAGEWNYSAQPVPPQPPVFGYGLQNTFPGVQPHINPRFANQLAFNYSQMSRIPQTPSGVGSPSPSEKCDTGNSDLQVAGHHHYQWEEGSG